MQQFSEEVLSTIRKKLEDEKHHLNSRIRQLSAQDPFSDPDRLNDNAAADAEANEESSHDRFAALVETLAAQVRAIDDALVRIGQGQYGNCVLCGNLIDVDRLHVLPTATLCLSCEKKKKR